MIKIYAILLAIFCGSVAVVVVEEQLKRSAMGEQYKKRLEERALKYDSKLDLDRIQVDIPVIGILLNQIEPGEFSTYKYASWESVINLIHYAGSYAAVMTPNMSDEELYAMLDSLNGVVFPGGPLEMFGLSGHAEPIQYYRTSKKIFNYAIEQADKGRYFPIIGICQGLQLFHTLVRDDNQPFSNVEINGVSRRLNFVDPEPETTSALFKHFPKEMIKNMASENLSYHSHSWAISTDVYNTSKRLREFFKVTSTDTFVTESSRINSFVMSMEAYDYPITAYAHHPESQTIVPVNDNYNGLIGRVNSETTDAIMYQFSDHITREGQKSLADGSHRFPTKEDAINSLFLTKAGIGHMFINGETEILSFGVN